MKIAIGSDHAGFAYKEALKKWLEGSGYASKDFGIYEPESSDYADVAHPLSRAVESKDYDLGILICGSANGVAMTANKHPGIRAAICWNEELASLARRHNNANIVCLPARFISREVAQSIVEEFLRASFEGGRHAQRVSKITC